jgi:hypothetical protein
LGVGNGHVVTLAIGNYRAFVNVHIATEAGVGISILVYPKKQIAISLWRGKYYHIMSVGHGFKYGFESKTLCANGSGRVIYRYKGKIIYPIKLQGGVLCVQAKHGQQGTAKGSKVFSHCFLVYLCCLRPAATGKKPELEFVLTGIQRELQKEGKVG